MRNEIKKSTNNVPANLLSEKLFNVTKDQSDKFQAIMTAAYESYESNKSVDTNWSYRGIVKNTTDEFGLFASWLVLIGKYNQQVCNGGHLQYQMNGYSDLHKELVSLTKKYSYIFTDDVYPILIGVMSMGSGKSNLNLLDNMYYTTYEKVLVQIESHLIELEYSFKDSIGNH